MTGQLSLDLDVTKSAEDVLKESSLGDTFWMGEWQIRNFNGFHQSREGGAGNWRFYVCGFEVSTCNVLLADGRKAQFPIDNLHRITVLGRKYGPEHWYH